MPVLSSTMENPKSGRAPVNAKPRASGAWRPTAPHRSSCLVCGKCVGEADWWCVCVHVHGMGLRRVRSTATGPGLFQVCGRGAMWAPSPRLVRCRRGAVCVGGKAGQVGRARARALSVAGEATPGHPRVCCRVAVGCGAVCAVADPSVVACRGQRLVGLSTGAEPWPAGPSPFRSSIHHHSSTAYDADVHPTCTARPSPALRRRRRLPPEEAWPREAQQRGHTSDRPRCNSTRQPGDKANKRCTSTHN